MRNCHICQTECQDKQACPTCVANFPNRRKAETMTREERVAEFELLCGVLETPWEMLHQRVEELVGRSVWSHEFAYPDLLAKEIRSGEHASFDEALGKIPAEKTIVVSA